jgi:hypothetical protein
MGTTAIPEQERISICRPTAIMCTEHPVRASMLFLPLGGSIGYFSHAEIQNKAPTQLRCETRQKELNAPVREY